VSIWYREESEVVRERKKSKRAESGERVWCRKFYMNGREQCSRCRVFSRFQRKRRETI